MNHTCSKCGNGYSPGRYAGSGAFCLGCSKAINEAADAAALYQRRIAAGDINVRPENEADARTVRRQIRRRLSSEPDCQYSWNKTEYAA